MKNNQNGFSVVDGLLILVILGILGFVGWYVWYNNRPREHKTVNANASQQTVQATDTSKSFSYSYPSILSLQKYVWSDCCEGPSKTEPDWSKVPQPISLKGKYTTADVVINITGDNTGAITIDTEYTKRTIDQFNKYSKLKINGYDAIYHVTDFVGPSNTEKYTDLEYLIVKGDKSVRLKLREKYSNSTLNGNNDFDATKLSPDYEMIVKSIKFLD
jgi:hypothetical protein